MRELDIVEHRLKTQIQTATEGLKLVGDMRKMLGQIDPAPKKNGTNGGHTTAATASKHPSMSASAKRKQREASKKYWADVKAGIRKRPGYKGSTPNV
jgi:hypothetical protein